MDTIVKTSCDETKVLFDTGPSRVYLSLGSNVGDRETTIKCALAAINDLPGVRLLRQSHLYETEPWGLTEQPKFYNIIAEIETVLKPLELLQQLKFVEQYLGRVPSPRWSPRPIDIDLVLWEGLALQSPELTVPHKHFRERAFVLIPLAELAPDWVDPESGITIAALARSVADMATVRRISE